MYWSSSHPVVTEGVTKMRISRKNNKKYELMIRPLDPLSESTLNVKTSTSALIPRGFRGFITCAHFLVFSGARPVVTLRLMHI